MGKINASPRFYVCIEKIRIYLFDLQFKTIQYKIPITINNKTKHFKMNVEKFDVQIDIKLERYFYIKKIKIKMITQTKMLTKMTVFI